MTVHHGLTLGTLIWVPLLEALKQDGYQNGNRPVPQYYLVIQ